jgi:hypothetical protein
MNMGRVHANCCEEASSLEKPWILDPVGAGATTFRDATLASYCITIQLLSVETLPKLLHWQSQQNYN